jgi:hypothetical protein
MYAVLESLARSTWERLRDARTLGIRFGEETITDLLLLELKRLGSGQIRIIQTPRSIEKTSGTDWEWWVRAPGNTGWYRFAIQAKRLDPRSNRYERLRHRVGPVLQLDLLKQYARKNRAIPLYCFFNHVDNFDDAKLKQVWRCCEEKRELQQLACTVVPLPVIEWVSAPRVSKTFSAVHSHQGAVPWRCLLKCPRLAKEHQQIGAHWDRLNVPLGADSLDFPWKSQEKLPPEIELGQVYLDRCTGKHEDRSGELSFSPRWVVVFGQDLDEPEKTEGERR